MSQDLAAAVSVIRPGDRVFIHSIAAAPQPLIQAMVELRPDLRDVEIVHLHTEGDVPYLLPECVGRFRLNALFVGANARKAVDAGNADYTPVFLSEVPALFRKRVLPIDVALIQVSVPDAHGFCSLGTSVEATLAAVQTARDVVAQVNVRMPRTHGDGLIHVSRISKFVEIETELPELPRHAPSPEEQKIGEHISSLIEDGSTLQLGIGAIPDAVTTSLRNHKRLGVHSEMISDGIVDLVECGAITGEEKKVHPGKVVAGFALGTRRLYDFVDDNPSVVLLDIAYVNDTSVIRRNPKVVAINSALEVDLTGQVCADSMGARIYSGVGGQMDFIRGASLSEGGKPIIALPSVARNGAPRIVSMLKPGAGVVTTRAHVHYIITEFGIADLYGRSLRSRAKSLIGIAHPDHREQLSREAHELLGLAV